MSLYFAERDTRRRGSYIIHGEDCEHLPLTPIKLGEHESGDEAVYQFRLKRPGQTARACPYCGAV